MSTPSVPLAANPPVRQSPPTPRDLEIFRLAEIGRHTHQAIADQHQLTRRRVSQIVQQVPAGPPLASRLSQR